MEYEDEEVSLTEKEESDSESSMIIATYNCLAVSYERYCGVVDEKWSLRCKRLAKHIVNLTADLVAFQEVDRPSELLSEISLFSSTSPQLFFLQRPSPKSDGVGFFLFSKRWIFISQHPLILSSSRAHVALLVFLKCPITSGYLAVLTTHLMASDSAFRGRSNQIREILPWASQTIRNFARDLFPAVEIPLIFCGDFNATPDEECVSLVQDWNLRSTFAERRGHSGHQGLKTFTRGGGKCIDYIFVSSDIHVVGFPNQAELESNVGETPNTTYPSDHLPLVCHLSVSTNGSERQ